jgi:hypothetical protein
LFGTDIFEHEMCRGRRRDGSVNIRDRNDTVNRFRFANPYVTRLALRMSEKDHYPEKYIYTYI